MLIPSFQIDHTRLKKGIYVSRKDTDIEGKVVATTFDIRMKEPYKEEPIDPASMHTIEHLAASYLRNLEEWKDKVIYWGPMGCMTGCYLILKGEWESSEIVSMVRTMFEQLKCADNIPGASKKECGNYEFMNLNNAKNEIYRYWKFLDQEITPENLSYPDEGTSNDTLSKITNEQKMLVLIDAYEHAIGGKESNWCTFRFFPIAGRSVKFSDNLFVHLKMGGHIEIVENSTKQSIIIDMKNIDEGFEKFCKSHPQYATKIIDGTYDSNISDKVFQYIALGYINYY